MTSPENTASAGGAQLVGAPGRPAQPDRPVRFADPVKNQAYWDRIVACVDAAPPLTAEQKAIIRAQFHTPAAREAA